MHRFDNYNTIFQKAVSFVNQTNRDIFLTGKAGTGKTTFLKYIRENGYKKMAVVAPTGVAAINAGGVTIHSFFSLPPGTYLPTQKNLWQTFDGKINNKNSLLKNLRFNSAKRELLRELELLIIDEVSMVRADTLDAIDAVLRHIRKKPMLPFGGVQVLYIGDLFQLPPVVKHEEWELLQEYYNSPFFFDAQVIQQAPPVYIELKKIYRQSEDDFIHLLNNIRNNCCTGSDLEHLHQYYRPDFSYSKEDNYITLTSHNNKADVINKTELDKLKTKLHSFNAEITGEFNDRSYPADEVLQLKEGAQIMFIKNDTGEARRYFNGKIGTIATINEEEIWVSFPGETDSLKLEKETWKNIRYQYNKEKDTIEEKELGRFSQYPIRLAWAITIHKSQGLTFNKAIIDAGASFAPGQVYVALSRLTNLNGLVLKSRILPHCISTDERIVRFEKFELPEELLQQTLEQEQRIFMHTTLMSRFSWDKITATVIEHAEGYERRKLPHSDKHTAWGNQLVGMVYNQQEVTQKFQKQLEKLLVNCEADRYQLLHQRTKAAADYFIKETDEKLIKAVDEQIAVIKKYPRVKKYLEDLGELKRIFERQKQQLQHTIQITTTLSMGMNGLLQLVENLHKPISVAIETVELRGKKMPKKEKGDSRRISLQLFKSGKTIPAIAEERQLVIATIEGHLADFIASGEIDILDIMKQEKLEKIISTIAEDPELGSSGIKQKLGNDFSYTEIRATMKFLEKEKQKRR